MMSLEVRRLRPEESAGFLVWFSEQLSLVFTEFPSAALNYYLAGWTSERLLETKSVAVVAWHDSKPAGCCLGAPVEGGVGTVIWLLSSPSHRGAGVGRSVFEAALAEYKMLGAHKIKLTAPTEEAVEFYQKMGMKTEGFHPNHWWGMDFWSLGIEV